jgi:glucoamylase
MPLDPTDDLDHILEAARRSLFQNISPDDGHPGAVIASPSRHDPDYYYFWVRDGALVMNVVLSLGERTLDPEQRSTYRELLFDFVRFSRICQAVPSEHGLGEPKFLVNGTVYTGEWGRPQNDGPALRAITLMRFADRLLDDGAGAHVMRDLYVADLPADSAIKADLEYLAHHWQRPNFDYWDEECATHFSTRMAQRCALHEGASLADRMNDPGAAISYRRQAALVGAELELHRDRDTGSIRTSIERVGGVDYKNSGLDTSVILGALHAEIPGQTFSVVDDNMLQTALRLRQEFGGLYEINIDKPGRPGVAIGRYPEDRYDGHRTDSEGNPWFLTTLALAEYHYRVASTLRDRGEVTLSATNQPFFRALVGEKQAADLPVGHRLRDGDDLFGVILSSLCREGDDFVRRALVHAGSGSLSEQFHRTTGMMTGASDLTWSYASLISALLHRPDLVG